MKRILAGILFLCLSGQMPLSSQIQLSQDQFKQELINAVSKKQEKVADTLIRNHRLMVKPFVDGLIREAITLELKGKLTESKKSGTIAGNTAEKFNDIFNERSLLIAVNYLTIWDNDQKENKLSADSLYALGTKYRLGSDPEKAIDIFQMGMDTYSKIGDERGEAEVLGGFGAVYFNNLRDSKKALKYYNDALVMREKVDDKALIGNTFNSLGSVNFRYFQENPQSTDYFEQAIIFYDKAEAIRTEIGDLAGLRTTKSYIAGAYKEYGNQMNITGRFNEAIESLEKAYEIDRKINAGSETGEVVSQIGFIYSKLGDYNTAAEKLTEAIKIMKEENDTLGLAGVYNHFGIVLQRAGRTERALEYYNNALKIYEERKDFADEIAVIGNMGTLFFDNKEYVKAEEYHTRGLSLCRMVKDQEKEMDYLLNLANDQIYLGKFDEALSNYETGLKLSKSLKNPDIIWRITLGMAECYESKGDYLKVVELNDNALSLLDSLRNTLQSEELKASYMARERFVFEDIIDLLATLHEKDRSKGYDKLAFSYSERSKSRVLLDLLSELQTKGNSNKASGNNIIRSPQPITLEETEELCPDNKIVILEYSVGDSSSCLWIITRSGYDIFKLPARKKLQEQIETIRFALLDPSQGISEFFTQAGSSLYNELIKPAEPYLSKGSKLIIIPDGVLNYLPFEVLLTENKKPDTKASYSDVTFLLKKYPVSYAQSASVLKTLISQHDNTGEKAAKSENLLAFGDPLYGDSLFNAKAKYPRLEYSGKEIENIASFFKAGSSNVYLRDKATEENLKQKNDLDKFNYIHFATHAFLNEEKPDLSSLVLTSEKNSGEDGFLQAAEIFNLKLNADLVVLSACQTGLGKLIRGEGMVGLTRAFMYAGTPSVVVSLWSVSDMSTASLMGEFYKNLIKNKLCKTDALRKAQLALINDEKYAHPFYWAPFILIGDWR
jgi:CHAT domain-containing protein/Tfp pilus assembly protein PilF